MWAAPGGAEARGTGDPLLCLGACIGVDARAWLQKSPSRIQSLRACDTPPAFHVLLNRTIYGFR